jgi:hypothetical protein
MSGVKKLYTSKDGTDPKQAFWNWFIENEKRFKAVFQDTGKAHDFLNELVEQMKPFNSWLKALAGRYDDQRFELIITADGDIALFSKVDELVAAAPLVRGWVITAHKPPIGADSIQVHMHGYEFGENVLTFYAVNTEEYPDEISIVLVHPGYKEEHHDKFLTAGTIYLQNTLGELNLATLVDEVRVEGLPAADKNIELIPVTKLKDYLSWREKEFVEKYASLNASRPEENYRVIEATGNEGKPVLAVIDAGFKNWEYRSAYPWLTQIDIDFKGNESGLPDDKQLKDLQQIEDELAERLEGAKLAFLIGHETHDGLRAIYFYTDKYYPVSKIVHDYLQSTAYKYDIVFHIRKDKYWKNMAFFFDAEEEEED